MFDFRFACSAYSFFLWVVKPYKRVFHVSPYCLVGAAFLTLVSQVAMVLSFFLPLKVVFLLGQEEVPHYIDMIWPGVSFGQVLFVFVAVSVVSYFVFLACNRFAEILSSKGSGKLLIAASKLSLFSDQEEVARKAYYRLGNFLAGCVFLFFSLILFWFFYHALFWMVVLSFVLVFLSLAFFEGRLGGYFDESYASIGQAFSKIYGILFLIVFVLMVLHVFYFDTVGVYLALVAMLLVRQLFQRLSTSTLDAFMLYSQKEKINALFLSEYSSAAPAVASDESIVGVIGRSGSLDWLQELDSTVRAQYECDFLSGKPQVEFVQSSIVGVLLFWVFYESKFFLLKLFDERRQIMSIHENDLLSSDEKNIPGLQPCFVSSVSGYKAQFYSVEVSSKSLEDKEFKYKRDLFRSKSFGSVPSRGMLRIYRNTHLLVSDRIKGWRECLSFHFFSDALNGWGVDDFINKVAAKIDELPLCYITPDVNKDSLIYIGLGQVLCLHWERWSIEPIGFGLSLPELDVEHLKLVVKRSETHVSNVELVRLCGLMSLFELNLNNQKFNVAAEFLALARESLDELSV